MNEIYQQKLNLYIGGIFFERLKMANEGLMCMDVPHCLCIYALRIYSVDMLVPIERLVFKAMDSQCVYAKRINLNPLISEKQRAI